MMHELHEKPRIVLGDDCAECRSKAQSGLDGLARIDNSRLRLLAAAAGNLKTAPHLAENASQADRQAIETLRLAARIVYASGITPEAAR